MPIYHLHAKTGTRANGQSAKAKNEYIEREGKYAGKNEEKRYDVQVIVSGYMPEWAAQDHREYWKAADQYERANGRLYKEIEFALPKELTPEKREKVSREFAEYLASKERMPYTFAIHINDPNNPHCHLMVSERANDGITRTPSLWFSRASPDDPSRGGAKKSTSLMPKMWLLDIREAWARTANQYLEEKIDHRTLKAQGIDRKPTKHRGVHGVAQEQRKTAKQLESEIAQIEDELAAAGKELAKLEAEEQSERARLDSEAEEQRREREERDRRIAELDHKLNNPPYWIGSAGYPGKEAAADVNELIKLEAMNFYDDSDGEFDHQEALGVIIERHPVILKIQQTLERSRGGIER